MIKAIVGIECGSKNSVISKISHNGIENIQSESSNREIPCVLLFAEDRRLFADLAQDRIKAYWQSSVVYPIRLCKGEEELSTGYLNSLIGKNIGQMQDSYLCVISSPNYFSIKEKLSLRLASTAAPLPCIAVIQEYVAVGYSYLWFQKRELQERGRRVAFIDVGESQTSCFVYYFQGINGRAEYISCSSDLGVRDIDSAISQYFKNRHSNILSGLSKKSELRLKEAVSKIRKELSGNSESILTVDCVNGEEDLNELIKRDDLENILKQSNWIQKLSSQLFEMKAYLTSINQQIDEIELLGGGTRIPCVQREIKNVLKKEKLGVLLQGSETVSRGCSIFCELSTSEVKSLVKIDNYQLLRILQNDYFIELIVEGQVVATRQFQKFTQLPLEDFIEYESSSVNSPQQSNNIEFSFSDFIVFRVEGVEYQSNIQLRGIKAIRMIYGIDENGLIQFGESIVELEQLVTQDEILESKVEYQGDNRFIRIEFEANEFSNSRMELLRQQEKQWMERDIKVLMQEEERNEFEKNVNEYLLKLEEEWKYELEESIYNSTKQALLEHKNYLDENLQSQQYADIQNRRYAMNQLINPITNKIALLKKYVVKVYTLDELSTLTSIYPTNTSNKKQLIDLSIELNNKNIGDGNSNMLMSLFKNTGAAQIKYILSQLDISRSLRLELANNSLTDNGMILILQSLNPFSSSNLKSFYLDLQSNINNKNKNILTHQTIQALDDLLNNLHSLQILEISLNSFSQQSADELLSIIAIKNSLKHFKLTVSPYDNTQFDRVAFQNILNLSCPSVVIECFNQRGMKIH